MKNNTHQMKTVILSALLAISACGPHPSEDALSNGTDTQHQEASIGESCYKSVAQPSNCNYGEHCTSIPSQCSAVPAPTCNNFSIHGTTWDPYTSTGPVIYDTKTARFTQDTIFCTSYAPMRITYRIKAYAPAADLPTSREDFSGRFYFVGPGGQAINASAIQNITTTSDRKNITFDVNLCVLDGTTSYTAGFFFVGGNGICATAS